jgi:DNA repair exonuclease SbcCD ATPase subunit
LDGLKYKIHLGLTVCKCKEKLGILKIKLKEGKEKKVKLDWVEKERRDIEKAVSNIQLDDLNEVKRCIQEGEEENKRREEKNQISSLAKKLFEEKKKLMEKREELVQLSSEASLLCQLKEVANEVEHDTLASVLDSIQNDMNEYLSLLFDDPMKVELSTVKVMAKKIKPSIHMKIFYKGYEMDGISSLSGGEADRVSLAMTLALNKFSSFPLVLLDEFASGLDLISKERAIQVLQSGGGDSGSKTFLCISHDTVQGIYDFVIQM